MNSSHCDPWDPFFFQDLMAEMGTNVTSTDLALTVDEQDPPAPAEVSRGLIHDMPDLTAIFFPPEHAPRTRTARLPSIPS